MMPAARSIAALAAATIVMAGAGLRGAQAQGASVQAIFQKHGLFGVFAADCTKAPGAENHYYVTRAIDANRAQRDIMDSPTSRVRASRIDKAVELKPDEIAFNETLDGATASERLVIEGIWQVERNRMRNIAVTVAGQKIVDGGVLLGTGQETVWLNKCG